MAKKYINHIPEQHHPYLTWFITSTRSPPPGTLRKPVTSNTDRLQNALLIKYQPDEDGEEMETSAEL